MTILCGKTRPQADPYEIWVDGDWTWLVLKKYQNDDRKPYARWLCAVKSPFTFGSYEVGDVYAAEVMDSAERVL